MGKVECVNCSYSEWRDAEEIKLDDPRTWEAWERWALVSAPTTSDRRSTRTTQKAPLKATST